MPCIWLTRALDNDGGCRWHKQTTSLQTSWNYFFMQLKVQQIMVRQFRKIMSSSTLLPYTLFHLPHCPVFYYICLWPLAFMGLKAWKGSVFSCLMLQSLAQWADMKLLIFIYQLLCSDRNSGKIFTEFEIQSLCFDETKPGINNSGSILMNNHYLHSEDISVSFSPVF